MTGLAHRQNAGFAPDIFAWLEGPFVSPRPVAAQTMPMEEHMADGRYVVRAELPGVDPAKDMEVSVAKGILTIRAERREDLHAQHRSEFRYGAYARQLRLPPDAKESDVHASYKDGILEIRVPLDQKQAEATRIEVART